MEEEARWRCISGFIQIPGARMRSKTCRFQYIFKRQNMELLLLFSIISPWLKWYRMTNFRIFANVNFSCISNSKYSAINRIFLLLNWNNTHLKSRPVNVVMRDILLIRFWGCFPFVTKESQILICPNFPGNTRIWYLLGTFDIWITLSDIEVNLRDGRLVSSKLHK